jgi:hypothetical protein
MLNWTTLDFVITSSELPVTGWTVPKTPESGGAAFTWAQVVVGVADTANKEMVTRCNRGCFIKMFFQPPVLWTLAV